MTSIAELFSNRNTRSTAPFSLPPPRRAGRESASAYIPSPDLASAIVVALSLRRPLLLTGEPGTGKTHAADYINWKLALVHETFRFEAKSASTARDLFYSYDTLGRFHAVQTKDHVRNRVDYIHYNALGKAILLANPLSAVSALLPPDFIHPGAPSQSLVLIDEIDKAPRDFPNDVLNEIEELSFRIPELDNSSVTALKDFQPVVVITSNSEKSLPPAFLRRCVYHHIHVFDRNRFEEIIGSRLPELVDANSPLLRDAVDFFTQCLRDDVSGLQKKPSTAELLDWLLYLLSTGVTPGQRLRDARSTVRSSLGTLVKNEDDLRVVPALLDAWIK